MDEVRSICYTSEHDSKSLWFIFSTSSSKYLIHLTSSIPIFQYKPIDCMIANNVICASLSVPGWHHILV
ncbi:hypothetical protein CBS63078_9014 [Aspergillus niger]|nr:hypothetical protein CBS133816_8196 [Aspergillus niger]KAI2834750.1 hypothetical protein CBS11350_10510 [Aspergillus niger]KAI2879043.1 hypothetical protein CBS115988_2819 [Aspergillus niger]KAI2885035.1 hypothetical protein CBS11852_8503 [Aspergillus niger]KAI2894085.1 hypothetical protein CBS63078_9014 [Aspergillus niger]